jgi:serine/threonine protein phosphatase PrpC
MTEIAVTYFGIFDGHAGADAAVMTSKLLHEQIEVWYYT